MNKHILKIPQAGFTVIEMILYSFFVTLIIGGSLGITYQLLSNSEALKSGIAVEEEANFLLRKIIWVLNDISAINSPAVNGSSGTLSVNKNDFGGNNPVVIDLDSGNLQIKRGSSAAVPLNTQRFPVSDLSFKLIRENSDPDSDLLVATFRLGGKNFNLTWRVR